MILLSVGDIIHCRVQNPSPALLTLKLETSEAAAFGTTLVNQENASWYKCENPEEHFKDDRALSVELEERKNPD